MKQFAVIGMGSFGYYLAARLHKKGHEVMAIDKNASLIQKAKDVVTQAVVADATDPEALAELGLGEMDTVVVCIGSILSNAILTVLNLQDLGVKHIMAKAISEPHVRVLNKIGVTDVVFPEKDLAVTTAEKLHSPNMLDYLPFLDDYSIVQMAPPPGFIGKKLKEVDLINKYGVQVMAIKELVPDRVNMIPTGHFVMKDSDILILLGPNKSLDKLRQQTGEPANDARKRH